MGSLGRCTSTIPSVPDSSPQHTIIVSDGINDANATFVVLTSSVSLNPSSGATGTSIAMNGSGLIASHGLTVTYDGSASGMPTSCTTDGSGNLSSGCTFTVPSSSSVGSHTITVSDGTNTPTATFTVTLLAVACSKSAVVVGSGTTCKATVRESGTKAPTGYASWSNNGSGMFSQTSCKLSRHVVYSACSVKFTPTAAGSVTLAASFGGDSENPAAAGGYNLVVTMKASKTTVSCTPGAAVVGSSTAINCKVKVIGYSATGAVTWSQSGNGSVSFVPTFKCSCCTLVKGSCSVIVTGTTPGKVILQATYSGDPNNVGSSGSRGISLLCSRTCASVVGTVSVGPSAPVCIAGQSCEVNMTGYALGFSGQGSSSLPYYAKLSSYGSYGIELMTGVYAVSLYKCAGTDSNGRPAGCTVSCPWLGCQKFFVNGQTPSSFPLTETLLVGQTTTLSIRIDTEIR